MHITHDVLLDVIMKASRDRCIGVAIFRIKFIRFVQRSILGCRMFHRLYCAMLCIIAVIEFFHAPYETIEIITAVRCIDAVSNLINQKAGFGC